MLKAISYARHDEASRRQRHMAFVDSPWFDVCTAYELIYETRHRPEGWAERSTSVGTTPLSRRKAHLVLDGEPQTPFRAGIGAKPAKVKQSRH